MSSIDKAAGFHATAVQEVAGFRRVEREFLESDLVFTPVPHPTPPERTITRERDLRYDFRTHFHPWVPDLARRLVAGGVPGLEAADTLYKPGGSSLPGSVRVSFTDDAKVTVRPGARLQMLDATPVQSLAGVVNLGAGFTVEVATAATLDADSGGVVTLSEGTKPTPERGTEFVLGPQTNGRLVGTVDAHPTGELRIVMPDGSSAMVPANARLRIGSGSPVSLLQGSSVVLDRSAPLPVLFRALFTDTAYAPSQLVSEPYPAAEIDFSEGGPYSVYNWELFFHAPFLVATHLSKNQEFAEAQKWYHQLFDPTDDSDAPAPDRFWKVRPFHSAVVTPISDILTNIATDADPELRRSTLLSIAAWQADPFRPHLVARYRVQSYMYKTVMAYLDNLIAWGDSLFRQDTGEAVDEATMIYVLAANILGPRPQPVPTKGEIRPKNYRQLKDAGLGELSTVLSEVEANIPFDLLPLPGGATASPGLVTLSSLGKSLYFGVPANDKLLGYWDVVADRLFKIRNSLNLQGVFRRLALFEPPIDPGMLARAAAAGLDVGSIVNGLNQPVPLVRFSLLAARAAELAQEVKALGAAVLSATENEDGEAMTLLRSRHERAVMALVEQQRYGALQEAVKSREGLLLSLEAAVDRYVHYERQLGRSEDDALKAIPTLDDLDRDALAKMRFSSTEPTVDRRTIDFRLATDLGGSGGKIVNEWEANELELLSVSRTITDALKMIDLGGQAIALVPDFGVDVHFWGLGGNSDLLGGTKFAKVAEFMKSLAATEAARLADLAGQTARIGGFARREMDWAFSSNSAALEINSILKQLRGAQLREAMAELELKNHRLQMENAEEIDRFLNAEGASAMGKKSNKALYTWMKRELKGLYADAFQFAFDAAKKAERAFAHELGGEPVGYVKQGYLGGKEGLLAGEKLYLDIKRMEFAYHELNMREYEMTRHVSLLQLDPLALLRLRTTGTCEVTIPESFYDLDTPGHYFRRIRSVAVTTASTTGPYTAVSCRLSLTWSRTRVKPQVADGRYTPAEGGDDRFVENSAGTRSIVTSTGQNDSGLFDGSLREDRYLPFEHAGAESSWTITLPGDPSTGEPTSFDYETISDVILQVRYTAREGGDLLKAAAKEELRAQIANATAPGTVRLFSIRHEFPSEWSRFINSDADAAGNFPLTFEISREHYPYWASEQLARVPRVTVLARAAENGPDQLAVVGLVNDQQPQPTLLTPSDQLGGLLTAEAAQGLAVGSPIAQFNLTLDSKLLTNLWFALTWASPEI